MKHDLNTLEQLHRAGHLEEARQGYLAFLRKNPREITAIHAVGIIAAQQKNFPEAVEYLQKAIALNPNDPNLYMHLGNVLKLQENFSQAIEALQKALQLNPNYTLAMNNLGTVFHALGKFDEAIQYYQRAIEKNPNYIDAYYNLGLAYAKQKNIPAAITAYEKLLTLSPDHFAARFHLACALLSQEKFSEALTQFLKIEEQHPHHIETQTNLATSYLKLGKMNEAKTHYLKALELAPEDTQILFNLGFINMQQGNTDSAIQHYQLAVKFNPDYFAAHNNLGVAFLAKQHVGFALHHFKEALRLQPDNAAIKYTVNMLSQHQHLLAAPSDYVKSLFDSYADHYDLHLVNALDYQVPKLLLDAVSSLVILERSEVSSSINRFVKKDPSLRSRMTSVATRNDKDLDILDLGCGTGLCGEAFKPYAKSLTGVDLSEKMLSMAKQKNIYDELIQNDLTKFLETKKSSYDLILAGDVFVYIGELDTIFKLIADALRPNGLLAFNAEISEKENFKMNQSGRFSHLKKYLDQLAEQNNFKIISYEKMITRTQNNEPVFGHIYVLQH